VANVTITQLPAAGTITGDELVPVVQNGQTVKATASALAGSPVQTQTFLTKNNEPTLENSRYLSAGTGLGLTDGGAQSFLNINLNGASGSLESASTGIVAKTASDEVTARTLTASGSGFSISNGDGVSGNPTFSLTGLPLALANTSGTGFLSVVGGSTIAGRTLTGTANQINIANGNGSDSPVFSIANNPVMPGVASLTIPKGTTAERPVATTGMIRYNTDSGDYEVVDSLNNWAAISAGGVTPTANNLAGGATGSIPYQVTSSVTTFLAAGSGVLVGGATPSYSTNPTLTGENFTNIPNGALDNSSLTFNGVTVALGASGTITASTTAALTAGTGIQFDSGTTFDGSTAKTIGIDSTVATLTGNQTLTNKTIDASSNTLQNIPNASLVNPSFTLGTSNIALGATELAPAGLTSVTVTQDPTTNFQLATKQYVDTLSAAGIHYHDPVYVEVPASTGNLNAVYDNGSSGVGATLTNAGTQEAFTADGVAVPLDARVLIYHQTDQTQNGVYTLTTVGDGSTNWVLTRATDADSYGPSDPNALGQGDAFFVTNGNTGAGETYVCNTEGTITFGSTAITFVQISSAQIYSAGTGLTLTGTQFSLTAPVVASLGGTGLTSYTSGDLVYYASGTAFSKLGIGSSTYILTSSGSAPQWSDPTGVTVGSATNATDATNAANVATSASSTDATFYPTFVDATTGNNAIEVDSNLTYNPSTNVLTAGTVTATTGIFGGTF